MNVSLLFLSCLAALLLGPLYLPQYPLFFFLPFLMIMAFRSRLSVCLAAAIGCGLIMDLLSGYLRLGIHAAAYAATTALLWWICRLFFFERVALSPFLAFGCSSLNTCFLMGIGWCMGQLWIPENSWWLRDLMLYSGLDGLYATLYLAIFQRFARKRSELLFG